MLDVKIFTFNPYQENTFVLSDETKECVIIDPGCYAAHEKEELKAYIEGNNLKVVKLLNTHGHIDHMLGNYFVIKEYEVPFLAHKIIELELEAVKSYGPSMGINPDISPMPNQHIDEGDTVTFGNTTLEVLFTPGHSPSHISFFHRASDQLFSGDVLFSSSIGRTDLPGGSYDILMQSIVHKLLPLGDDVKVYCGHGSMTTIGQEKQQNMFILQYMEA